jgi:polyphenol oxidase
MNPIKIGNSTSIFGTAAHALFPDRDKELWKIQQSLKGIEPFSSFMCNVHAHTLICARQVHGTEGIQVTGEDPATLCTFTSEADWLLTTERGYALGIFTADCIPIILIDPILSVIAAVHVGWRGAVHGIMHKVLVIMINKLGCARKNIRILVGPYARTCCYEVDPPFCTMIAQTPYGSAGITTRGTRLYFDLLACCYVQVHELGISTAAFDITAACCTICTPGYYSYRRHKNLAGRQLSLVCLS